MASRIAASTSFLRNMQGTHLVPVRRLRREIARRLSRASPADLVEPGAVGGKMRIAKVPAVRRDRVQRPPPSRLRDPEENPRSFAMALDKPGFDKEFEMAGYAWLRFGPRMVTSSLTVSSASATRQKQPQTRGFTRRGGGGENGIESYGIGQSFLQKSICSNNMQILFYM